MTKDDTKMHIFHRDQTNESRFKIGGTNFGVGSTGGKAVNF